MTSMQIQKTKDQQLEVKTKNALIIFDGKITINTVELEGSGDYEVADVIVEGVDDYIYIFKLEDMVVGSVNFRGEISKENVNKLSSADLLIVSLNGHASKAIDQINNIETNATIYIGASESRDILKKNGITAEEIENLKFTKADFTGDQKTYFIETNPHTLSWLFLSPLLYDAC